jgi:hypothetical protein
MKEYFIFLIKILKLYNIRDSVDASGSSPGIWWMVDGGLPAVGVQEGWFPVD